MISRTLGPRRERTIHHPQLELAFWAAVVLAMLIAVITFLAYKHSRGEPEPEPVPMTRGAIGELSDACAAAHRLDVA